MSNVLIVNEDHLQKTPDGNCWSNGVINYQILQRYLAVFDEILLAIRVKNVAQRDPEYIHLCSGKGVTILPIEDFSGHAEFIKKYRLYNKRIKECCKLADCAIVRTPNAISFQFLRYINRHMPYALEVTVEPWSWLAPGNYKSKFRPVMRCLFTLWLKKYCLSANGVAYVTKEALQKKFPCRAIKKGGSNQFFTAHYSTVSIGASNTYPYKEYKKKPTYKLIHIANSINTYGKGHKECIEIVKRIIDDGISVSIDFVGDGSLKEEFQKYAYDKGIENKVHFIGRLNRKEEIWKVLREADVLLFPTHSEGLPRVLIEAMFVGTPCVSTNVGGIPELLEEECIARVGDVDRMYEIILRLLRNPEQLTELSKKGIAKSASYAEDILQNRRISFYKKLKTLCMK